jgi:hypothetical protein
MLPRKESPFKKNFTWQYAKWISMAKHPLTPTQRLKWEALLEVYQLLITSDLISKSFKVMGISNAWT